MILRFPSVDTLVIGAGAAGLAAAADLSAAGQSVSVLEARDRIGGRIHTLYGPDLPIPVELGAEFIHGESKAILSWLAKSNTTVIDATRTRWVAEGGRLRRSEGLFEEMKRGLSSTPRPRKDLPFSEFLEGPARRKLSPRARKFARRLVEGFDAADATRVSTLETLDEWSGNGAADSPTFRPWNGYGALIQTLHGALDPARAQVRLGSIVREIRWQRGGVVIAGLQRGQSFEARAQRAVIALPLGVLQWSNENSHAPSPLSAGETPAGAVTFVPEITQKQSALEGLAAGPVIKVILRFRRAFWEEMDEGSYRNGTFFNAPGAMFPTFWSALPARAPLLTAWAAGPNAMRLAGSSEETIVQHALASVDALFGKRANARAHLQGAYGHDWQADPFARGAYSYVLAGGSASRKALSSPLQGTLFFAGEAADVGGESGTVAGALQSGARAARQVLAAARRSVKQSRN